MPYNTPRHSHTFEAGDIEHFAAFADFMNEHLPQAEVTFVEKPMFGPPYVQVNIRNIWEACESYTLMVDPGQTFHIGFDEAWVTGGISGE